MVKDYKGNLAQVVCSQYPGQKSGLRSVIILIGILIGGGIIFSPGLILMSGIIALTGIALWHFLPEQDRKFLMKLFIIGLSVRVIFFALFYIISISHGGYGEVSPDSRLYFLKALDIMRSWTGEAKWQINAERGVGLCGPSYILAFLYKLTGYNPDIGHPVSLFSDKLINCLIGTLSGISIFYLTKDIFGGMTAKISAVLVVFYPTLILWSMTNMRESINILLVSIILFSLVRFQKVENLKYILLFLISLLLLKTIRLYVFFVVVSVAVLSFLVFAIARVKRKGTVIVILMVAIGLILTFTSFGQTVRQSYFNLNSLSSRLLQTNYGIWAQGGSTYRIYDDFMIGSPSWLKLVGAISKGTFYFILVPFPWAISTKLQLLTYPQVMLWYILIPFTILGIAIGIRFSWKSAFAVLAYVFILTISFGAIEANVGSALRHRDLVMPFFFIFAASGIVKILGRSMEFEEKT